MGILTPSGKSVLTLVGKGWLVTPTEKGYIDTGGENLHCLM